MRNFSLSDRSNARAARLALSLAGLGVFAYAVWQCGLFAFGHPSLPGELVTSMTGVPDASLPRAWHAMVSGGFALVPNFFLALMLGLIIPLSAGVGLCEWLKSVSSRHFGEPAQPRRS